MATLTLTFTVRISWWVPYYVAGIVMMAQLTGLEPCPEAIDRWLRRGTRIVVE